MAPWLLPALKAVLPHVGTIISVAAPVFTRRGPTAPADQAALLQEQITELQTAASQNASHMSELAAQLQQSAAIAEARIGRALWLCAAAALLSAGSLCLALYVLLVR